VGKVTVDTQTDEFWGITIELSDQDIIDLFGDWAVVYSRTPLDTTVPVPRSFIFRVSYAKGKGVDLHLCGTASCPILTHLFSLV